MTAMSSHLGFHPMFRPVFSGTGERPLLPFASTLEEFHCICGAKHRPRDIATRIALDGGADLTDVITCKCGRQWLAEVVT